MPQRLFVARVIMTLFMNQAVVDEDDVLEIVKFDVPSIYKTRY